MRRLQRRLQDLVDGRLVDARHGDDERRAVHEAPDDVADEDDGQRRRDEVRPGDLEGERAVA